MRLIILTLFLLSQAGFAQYTPVQEIELESTNIQIPESYFQQKDINLERCKISFNGEFTGIKDITTHYVARTKLLEKHLRKCLNNEDFKINLPIEEKKTFEDWTVQFEFGFSKTHYFNTDIHVNSPAIQGTIHDFNFSERTSAGFYNPANWEQWMDAFRWIDEPTNHFIISLKKKNHVFILSIFHPKWLIGENHNNYVEGTIDGIEVAEYMDLDVPFEEDYSNFQTPPGEIRLVRFENTHLQMEWSLGYGYDFTIFSTNKLGKLKFQPAVYAGFLTGANFVVTRKKDNYWEYDGYKAPMQVQGPMVAAGAKISWDFGLINLFYQFKFTHAWIKENEAWGGTVQYNHKYMTNTFGVGIDLFNGKRRKKKRELNKF